MGQEKSQRRKRPMVVSKHGRYRFQTGMVTASLLQRGLSMADAFAISNALKDKIAALKEVSTDDLEGVFAHHKRLDAGELTFGLFREMRIKILTDYEPEDAIAEKLELFVVVEGRSGLIRKRAVRKSKIQETEILESYSSVYFE